MGSFSKESIRSVRLVFFMTLGLLALAIAGRQGGSSTPVLFAELKTLSGSSQSLSCSEILKVAQWGQKHYGGGAAQDLKDARRKERVLQLFTEKLDPYKLLFTAPEVLDFKEGASRHWGDLVENKSCLYFSSWIEANYPRVKQRLSKNILRLPGARLAKKHIGVQKESAADLKKEDRFASSPEELQVRIEKAAIQLLEGTSKEVVEAFHGNITKLLESGFAEYLVEKNPSEESKNLLAKALLGSLDPYSTYLSKEEYDDFSSDLSGGATGIGIRVRQVPEGLIIEKILADSSAFEASKKGALAEGDVIEKIDGQQLAGLGMERVRDLLKGEEDTQISFSLLRKGGKAELLSLTRKRFDFEEARIQLKDSKNKDVSVIEIPSFYGSSGMGAGEELEPSSANDLREIVGSIVEKGKRGVVLDLRSNPGGFLEEAVSMAGMFVGSKPVVGVQEKEKTRILSESGAAPIYTGPLVVLVDEGTASAGEVLAGALKDLQRAVIVGPKRTYGKGCVQKLFQLDQDLLQVGLTRSEGNGVLKLTTSIFYSPLGHSPANGGVESNIVLSKAVHQDKSAEYGKAFEMQVPEIQPLLNDIELAELKLKGQIQEKTIELLRGKSEERAGGNQLVSKQDADLELEEAISIASDLAEISSKQHPL